MAGRSALLVTALLLAAAGRSGAAAEAPRAILLAFALAPGLGADPHWRRHLGDAVAEANRVLGPHLEARFVLDAIGSWSPRGGSLEEQLDELAALGPPAVGRVVIGVAEAPRGRSPAGLAGYQECRAVVAAAVPGPSLMRVIVHELAHVFGALHRPGETELMAASASGWTLDPVNARLLALHRDRRLAPHLAPLEPPARAAARAAYQEALAEAPVEAALRLGLLALEDGDAAVALEAADVALARDPTDLEAGNLRGIALRRLGRYREAVAAYEAALARRPRHAPLHHNLAIALDRLGERERSIAAYERAVELDPGHVSALSNLARLLALGGDPRRAASLARRALELAPDYVAARVNLALAHLESDEPAAAEREARTAVAERPDLAEAHEALGGALLALRRPAEAAESFARAAERSPGEPRYRRQRAVALLGLGRLQRASGQAEALASLEGAVELDPENADALSELADARFERGLSGPARESYERLLRLRPQDAAAHNNLAVLLFRAGDVAGARRHVDEAAALGLAVHPDFLAALARAER